MAHQGWDGVSIPLAAFAGMECGGAVGLGAVRLYINRAIVREVAVLSVGHWHRGLFVRRWCESRKPCRRELKKVVGDYFRGSGSPKLIALWRVWGHWDARVEIGEEILASRGYFAKRRRRSVELVGPLW